MGKKFEATPKELREYAADLTRYAKKMPGDKFVRRWTLTASALNRWADQLDKSKAPQETAR